MSDDTFDPWALSDGLVDDVDITITEATFTTDSRYQNGEALLLKLIGTTAEGAEFDGLYACGNGWEAVDGGSRAQREDGSVKNFNKSSKIGLLIAHAVECGAGEALRSKGTQFDAKVWEGLSFHFNRVERDYGGDIGKKQTLLPTKFLGVVGGGSASTPTATTTSTPNTPAPAQNGNGNGLDPILNAKLKALAVQSPDHSTFIDKAFAVDGVMGNPVAEAAVIDESAIFALAKAGQ